MLEYFSQLIGFEGLGWLIFGAFVAGCARGFSGFGAALVYMPIAGQLMDPIWALVSLIIIELIGPLPLIPNALRHADRAEVKRLGIGACLVLPIGVWVLSRLDPIVFRYLICGLTLTLPLLMASGWRFSRPVGPFGQYGVGAVAGFFGGVAGAPGPPVILMQMAQDKPAVRIRATSVLFLLIVDLAVLIILSAKGELTGLPVLLGLAVFLPNLLGNMTGAALFDPNRQGLYRAIGYVMMIGSGLIGLPFWDALVH